MKHPCVHGVFGVSGGCQSPDECDPRLHRRASGATAACTAWAPWRRPTMQSTRSGAVQAVQAWLWQGVTWGAVGWGGRSSLWGQQSLDPGSGHSRVRHSWVQLEPTYIPCCPAHVLPTQGGCVSDPGREARGWADMASDLTPPLIQHSPNCAACAGRLGVGPQAWAGQAAVLQRRCVRGPVAGRLAGRARPVSA